MQRREYEGPANDPSRSEAVPKPRREHGSVHSGIERTGHAHVPDDAASDAATEILNAGERVAILAGAGAPHATDELVAAA